MKQRKAFVCYSHSDTEWLDRLRVHLAPLVASNELDLWSDKRILTGDQWKLEIEKSLNDAAIAIILVSADFFASNFIAEVELPKLLRNAEKKSTRIMPVVVGPTSALAGHPLGEFQSVNDPQTSLSEMPKPQSERILSTLATQVRDFLSTEIVDAHPHRSNADAGTKYAPADAFDYNSLASTKEFSRQEIYLPSLVRRKLPPIISGYKFTDCQILGPSVIMLGDKNSFANSGFAIDGNDPNSIFIPLDRAGVIFGVIQLLDCSFDRCDFRGIAFLGSLEQMAGLKARILGRL